MKLSRILSGTTSKISIGGRSYRIAGMLSVVVQYLSNIYDLLPAHTRRDHAQWLPSDLIGFVHHEEIGRSLFRPQRFLAMLDRPFQLLDRDQDLSERGVDLSLA